MDRLKLIINEFLGNWKDISFHYAFLKLKLNFNLKNMEYSEAQKIHQKGMLKLSKKLCKTTIKKFRKLDRVVHEWPIEGHIVPIWVCWWQGEADMPEIVSVCYKKLKENAPQNTRVKLITLENYKTFVTISPHVIKKFESGQLTYTFFSDILRFHLLYKYGGLWVDATVYIPNQISEDLFKLPIFTNRRRDGVSDSVSGANYTSFLMGGQPKHLLFLYMNELFDSYLKKYDKIPDYWFVDYALRIALDDIKVLGEAIREIPYNNPRIWELERKLNNSYEESDFNKITSDTNFFKLTFKNPYEKKSINGDLTYFGFLLNSQTEVSMGNEASE